MWLLTRGRDRRVFGCQEQIESHKERLKLIDAAPIKKIAEAKARKKKRVSAAV